MVLQLPKSTVQYINAYTHSQIYRTAVATYVMITVTLHDIYVITEKFDCTIVLRVWLKIYLSSLGKFSYISGLLLLNHNFCCNDEHIH